MLSYKHDDDDGDDKTYRSFLLLCASPDVGTRPPMDRSTSGLFAS